VVGGNVAQGATTGTPGGQKVGATGWITPRGPYPDAAARAHIQGTLLIRVSTDASGRIVEAVVTRPADPLLDAAARTMARSIWKGPPNSSKTVTVIYKM
jgi:TonB family protein